MAQILTTDIGVHNANLEATNLRLTKDGAWKKQRVIHVLPVGKKGIPNKVLASLMGMISPPNQAKVPLIIEEAEVGAAYDEAVAIALGNTHLREFEYLLCSEHDNTIPPTGLLDLIRHMEEHPEFAAISGLYFTKGPGGVAQIWGDVRDPVINFRPQPPDLNGKVVECYGIGQGFGLFRMEMFRGLEAAKVPRPWFKTVCGPEGCGTQDLAFWGTARKYGYRCAVACDVRVGHMDPETGVVW